MGKWYRKHWKVELWKNGIGNIEKWNYWKRVYWKHWKMVTETLENGVIGK